MTSLILSMAADLRHFPGDWSRCRSTGVRPTATLEDVLQSAHAVTLRVAPTRRLGWPPLEGRHSILAHDRPRSSRGSRRFRCFSQVPLRPVGAICQGPSKRASSRSNSCSSPRDLEQRLRRITPEGITEGSLFVPQDYLTLPVLQ